ncbi:hypothetical protein FRC10_000719 [Ceratobasidium sp. 414]|nr:hypothetical protein FRC10_000719 [Ceratobasidium sp. 414]
MSFNSYIAGLNLPFTGTQVLNGFACASTVGIFYVALPSSELKQKAEKEAGRVVHTTSGPQGLLITVAHTLGLLGPAAAFLLSLPLSHFETPDWLLRFTLPPATSNGVYYGLRVAGVIGSLGLASGIAWTVRSLGPQWHYIGVMFWNWIPLVGAGLTAVAFGVKIPMEEKLMLNSKGLGGAYENYKKEVPWRVIPYIW